MWTLITSKEQIDKWHSKSDHAMKNELAKDMVEYNLILREGGHIGTNYTCSTLPIGLIFYINEEINMVKTKTVTLTDRDVYFSLAGEEDKYLIFHHSIDENEIGHLRADYIPMQVKEV